MLVYAQTALVAESRQAIVGNQGLHHDAKPRGPSFCGFRTWKNVGHTPMWESIKNRGPLDMGSSLWFPSKTVQRVQHPKYH